MYAAEKNSKFSTYLSAVSNYHALLTVVRQRKATATVD